MRKGGCVPLSLRVCVLEILGRNTWDALSRRYDDASVWQDVVADFFKAASLNARRRSAHSLNS